MKVLVKEGELLEIGFEDEEGFEVDGHFRVMFDAQEARGELRVEADLPDTAGRTGTIYSERFRTDTVEGTLKASRVTKEKFPPDPPDSVPISEDDDA